MIWYDPSCEAVGKDLVLVYHVQQEGEIMKRAIVGLAVLLVGAAVCVSQDAETVNLSWGRELGVGIQLDFPFGGLLSTRYWIEPAFGIEGILFVWGNAGDVEGTLTARALYRIADASVVDFYAVAGASMPFESYGTESIILSAGGGIEFGFRFAPSLAWNIEFGLSMSAEGDVGMLFGTGIHFYFLEDDEAAGG
jgi:hypothetical protein